MNKKHDKHVLREKDIPVRPFWELCLDMSRDQEIPASIKIYTVDHICDRSEDIDILGRRALKVIAESKLEDFACAYDWACAVRNMAICWADGDLEDLRYLLASQGQNRDDNSRDDKGDD